VPFAHCGRTEAGLDCVGVVLECYKYACVDLGDFRGYSRQAALNDSRAMLQPILERFQKIKRTELEQGDLLLFSVQGVLTHVGIYIGEDEFVHAYEGSVNKVILDRLTKSWQQRLKGVFRLR
jgi:cell wall-associated NlpC family hydrolase